MQQELVRLREKEREALEKVTEVEHRLKKGEKLTAEDQEKLLQAEQLQQQIRERVGDDKDGLRAELKRILEALKQNGMEKSAVQERMTDVSREMDRLAENELEQIEPRLTNAASSPSCWKRRSAKNARPNGRRGQKKPSRNARVRGGVRQEGPRGRPSRTAGRAERQRRRPDPPSPGRPAPARGGQGAATEGRRTETTSGARSPRRRANAGPDSAAPGARRGAKRRRKSRKPWMTCSPGDWSRGRVRTRSRAKPTACWRNRNAWWPRPRS